MPILKHAWAHGLSESLFYLGLINMNNRTRAAKKIVTEMVIYRADDGTRSSSLVFWNPWNQTFAVVSVAVH